MTDTALTEIKPAELPTETSAAHGVGLTDTAATKVRPGSSDQDGRSDMADPAPGVSARARAARRRRGLTRARRARRA